MSITLAYDVYGTLVDTRRISDKLDEKLGDDSSEFASVWRDKQLEYSFRRGLMDSYKPFAACARQAFDYTCRVLEAPLDESDREELMGAYRTLPAFTDAAEGLRRAHARDFRLFALSNGSPASLETLLDTAGLRSMFIDLVSAAEIETFKPNPAVYGHFIDRSGAAASETWLVSSNPFDVIGAISAGLNGAWVRRSSEAVFDPWEIEPTVIVDDLRDLPDAVEAFS